MDREVICHVRHRVLPYHLRGNLDLIWCQGTWTADSLPTLTRCRHPCARALGDQRAFKFG
ncbi:hypothetical protein WT05_21595 [Burkholderia stagnalis]|nr:hypothetical protein WT05_21595 [Burkholderia stagnalis]